VPRHNFASRNGSGSLLLSVVTGALGEIGDKTQVLVVLLAARFERPIPIILGLFVSTAANYGIAALFGEWIGTVIGAESLRWVAGFSFLAIAIMALKADRLKEPAPLDHRYGVFALTLASTFVAELGDKTQLATAVLAAKYGWVAPVVAGMTLGVIAVDAPLILVARTVATKLRWPGIRFIVAGLFAIMGVATLMASSFG